MTLGGNPAICDSWAAMRKYLIVDVFGTGRGHTVNYVQCLVDTLGPHVDLTVWTSKALCEKIDGPAKTVAVIWRLRLGGWLLRLGILLSLILRSMKRFDSVVFSSFDEVTLALLGRRRLSRCSVVVTNNLPTPSRLKSFFMRRGFQRVRKILVHTEFQKQCIVDRYGVDPNKIIRIPHYSVGFDRGVTEEDIRERREVIFLGGSGRNKLQREFVRLVADDVSGTFDYGVYGSADLTPEELSILRSQNASLELRYLTREEYFDILKRAKYVVLLYRESFSVKVSGIFFDAVSCLTPVIATDIPSFSTYFREYGPLGVLVNLKDAQWTRQVLTSDICADYDAYIENARTMKAASSHARLRGIYLGL